MADDPAKEYLRILGFANGNPVVIGDIGNALGKMLTDQPIIKGNNPFDFVDFQHGIAEVNKSRWNTMLSYRNGKSAYDLIRVGEKYFAVGDTAYSVQPDFDPIVGRAKYSRDYYGVLFLSGVCRLFEGNPPKVINAFLAHPSRDRDFKKELMRSVAGKWSFYCGSKHIEMEVSYVNTWEEAAGGATNATTGVDGKPIKGIHIVGDGPTLVFDLGGGSLDMVRLNKDGSIDYDYGLVSQPLGVNKAVNAFKQLFDDKYRNYLDDAENGFPRDRIHDIFMDEKHEFRAIGQTFDCRDLYEDAVAPIIREARNHVRSFTRGRLSFNRVLIDGGGSALLYKDIVDKIFPDYFKNSALHLADARNELHKANSRGAKKLLPMLRQESEIRARNYAKTVDLKNARKS